MHFTQLLGICLLPTTSLAVPVALSLSIVVNDVATADFAHHQSGMDVFSRGGHDRFASVEPSFPEKYLGYLSDYAGNLTEADKALKDLKLPEDEDDNDTWEEFFKRSEIANEAIDNATSAIRIAVYEMRGSPFDGKFNKAETKTITEALGNNFAKINETLIDPITAAVKSLVFFPRPEGSRLQNFGFSLADLASRTALRCHFDNQDGDPDKGSDFDKATWRNIDIVVDARNAVRAAGNTLSDSRVVSPKHRLPASQWKLQL